MFGVRCECRDRGECRGAIGSCACVARHAFNSSINNPGMATVRHRLPDLGDWCSPMYVRFTPECVAKLFCPFEHVRLIQEQASMRNVDSRIHSLRFDCCVFLFYSFSAVTFATQSCQKRAVSNRSKQCAYSITSSAVASSDGGTLRPSIRAVEALMTNSNLLACKTGRSPGLAPLRRRPT